MKPHKPNQKAIVPFFYNKGFKTFSPSVEKVIIMLLLTFPPLAYGAVQIWSVTIVQVFIIVATTILILRMTVKGHITIYGTSVDLLALLFLVLVIISAIISVYPYASRIALHKILSYIIFFYLVINIIKTRKQLGVLVWSIVLFGGLFATTALIMENSGFLGFRNFSNPEYITLTFVNRNHFAGYLEMMVWLCVALAYINKGTKRILLFGLAVYIAVAISLSLSRGGIIGLLGSFVFLSTVQLFLKGRRKEIIFTAVFFVFAISFLAWIGIQPVINRMETLSDPEIAGRGRLEYWTGTINMIKSQPWFGTGIGTYASAYPRYQTEYASNLFVSHAHNDYLELTAEMGLTGLIATVSFVGIFMANSLRQLFALKDNHLQTIGIAALASCFSLLVHSFTDFNFHIPSNALLFATCAAIVLACINISKIKIAKPFIIKVPKKFKATTIVFTIILGTSAIGAILPPYIGDIYKKKSIRNRNEKDFASELTNLEKAAFLNSGNPEHFVAMGNLMLTNSQNNGDSILGNTYLEKAVENYNNAIKLCPVRGYFYSKKGFTLRRLQKTIEEGEAFGKAVYFSPMSAYTHYDLASYFYRNSETEKACIEYKKALQLDSRYLTSVLDQLTKIGRDYEYIKQTIPEDAALRKRFARYLFNNGNERAGIEELAFAFDLEPTARNARDHVNGYYRIREHEKALQLCEKYLSRFINDFNLNIQMANICLRLKDYDKAKEIYDKLLKENPTNAALYYTIANYYRQAKNQEKRLECLKQAVFLKPENANYRYQLGLEYKKTNLNILATEQFGKCLEIDTGHINSKKALAGIREMVSAMDDAKN